MLRGFAAVDVMHCAAMECLAVLSRVFTAGWETPMIAVAIVEMMVYMPVKMLRAVEPRSSADKYSAREPLRAIVTIGCAVIRGSLIVPIGTNWRFSDADCNLCISLMRGS